MPRIQFDDERGLTDSDYSIGGGVTMKRPMEHGFGSSGPHDMNDRIRGTLGTRRGEHYGKGPKGWKPSDEKILEEVSEVLHHNPRIDASDVDVSVEEGCVYLRGTVESRSSKKEAERSIEDITGVMDVMNDLRVRPQMLT